MTLNKPKRGRPHLEAGKTKDSRVILRLATDERERYDSQAKKLNLSLSAWIRKVLSLAVKS
jgi:hypothetical protein